ncbi:MAG: hypothetical protein DMD82_05565 [Candidatus Rokuibacteriota bacterium]|nr:MAG: hypothetical protein DMD82_05565 [Candidatus Rokubacteria bacterium]
MTWRRRGGFSGGRSRSTGRSFGAPAAVASSGSRPRISGPTARCWSRPACTRGTRGRSYRPTFGENQYWVEAHLIDFTGDLYDRVLGIALVERIREERKFSDVDALRRQIRSDIATAAEIL